MPYLTLFDERPIGTVLLFAAALGLWKSVVSARLLGAVCVFMTSLALRGIALRAGLSRGAAFAAALLYPAYSSNVAGLPTNLEIVFAPFTAWAFWVASNPADPIGFRHQARAIAGAGLLIGLGIWIKYLPVLPGFVLFAMLAGSWWARGLATVKAVAALAIIYVGVLLLPTLFGAMVYFFAGKIDEFWYCNVGFMSTYITFESPIRIRDILGYVMALWPILFLAAVAIVLWRDRPALVAGATIWLAAELVAVCAPGQFFDHYFLILLPPLCVLSGCALDALTRRFVVPGRGDIARVAVGLTAAAVPLAATASLALGHGLPIRQPDIYRRVAAIIREDGGPIPTVWVVNSQPIIYFLAGAALPSRFAHPVHLVGQASVYMRNDPMSRTDPPSEIRRILGTRPRYLVVDQTVWSLVGPELRPLIDAAIDSDYMLLASVTPGWRGPLPIEIYRRKSEAS